MSKLIINKNGQCSINIPKELINALNWKKDDIIIVSKMHGHNSIVIENMSKVNKQY